MDYLISMIVGWGPSWAPRGWTLCQGQLLPISSNTTLFSLIGTIYGGDGRTTFALPDLRGRAPIGSGQGPGTSYFPIGAKGGSEHRTLTTNEMPPHNHTALNNLSIEIGADNVAGDTNTPSQSVTLAAPPKAGVSNVNIYKTGGQISTSIQGGVIAGNVTIGSNGGGQSFSVVQPIQAINYIMCIEGIYPSRN